jgi:hypothetical protein
MVMQKCSERAYAKCPYRHECGTIHEATFADNSDCAEFNRKVDSMPMTNADRIRAMSDEELAKFIVGNAVGEEYQTYEYEFSIENVRYFKVDYEHQGETVEDSVLYWLKQPAEVE